MQPTEDHVLKILWFLEQICSVLKESNDFRESEKIVSIEHEIQLLAFSFKEQ